MTRFLFFPPIATDQKQQRSGFPATHVILIIHKIPEPFYLIRALILLIISVFTALNGPQTIESGYLKYNPNHLVESNEF